MREQKASSIQSIWLPFNWKFGELSRLKETVKYGQLFVWEWNYDV